MTSTAQYRPSPLSSSIPSNSIKPASPLALAPTKKSTTSSASPLLFASQKKKAMSITQTYYLAHKARAKLSTEAARADHDLRLLVGHANLLDSLMLELADAEREQENWFNQSVRGAEEEKKQQQQHIEPKKERHIQWADTIVEDPEEDWLAEDASSESDSSDSDSDEYDSDEEEDVDMQDVVVPLARVPSQQTLRTTKPLLAVEEDEDYDDDMEEDDLEEDYAQLELVRTTSHLSNSPPELELDHDSEDSDEDESMPPSPPNAVLSFSDKEAKEEIQQQQEQQQEASSSPASGSFYSEGFYLPRRSPARLVSAISVY